jgi:phenylpyruvate tautomerase PptA (4-oxalocrotonate tautomerase family)
MNRPCRIVELRWISGEISLRDVNGGENLKMPMLDAIIPEGALTPDSESRLLERLTDILLINEGADPTNQAVRAIAWIFLHRPVKVFVAGAEAAEPRYRLTVSVPEGQFDNSRRSAMVKAITDAVLDAEDGSYERNPDRVWVFATEVPDGTWGGRGQIVRLQDIATMILGDAELGRKYAEKRLAISRQSR